MAKQKSIVETNPTTTTSVSFQEFRNGLGLLGLALGKTAAREEFHTVDLNMSGTIGIVEFCTWLAQYRHPIDAVKERVDFGFDAELKKVDLKMRELKRTGEGMRRRREKGFWLGEERLDMMFKMFRSVLGNK